MTSKRKVLVFPAGTEIGLEIYKSLYLSKEIELHGAGISGSNTGKFVYPHYHFVPDISDSSWIARLIKICKEYKINYIYPAHDDVIIALSENKELIPSCILIPSSKTCQITRYKSKTYIELGHLIRVPKMFNPEDNLSYPVFLKPDRGQGSKGAKLINSKEELDYNLRTIENPIICEYLPGKEYTVDCFSHKDKGLLFCGPRLRIRMRNGIAVHTRCIELTQARQIAITIQDALKMRGAWFFQLKESTDGALVLLEVAPRIAGTMCANRAKGVNFPLLTIFERESLNIQLLVMGIDPEVMRPLENICRYELDFDKLYIDLDDTLILRDRVNLEALKLIFNCINAKKSVTLITRHNGDLEYTLKNHRISNLFDEIVHITDGTPKSMYISSSKSIFVDDSFKERLDVSTNCMVSVFDCSMLESLNKSIS